MNKIGSAVPAFIDSAELPDLPENAQSAMFHRPDAHKWQFERRLAGGQTERQTVLYHTIFDPEGNTPAENSTKLQAMHDDVESRGGGVIWMPWSFTLATTVEIRPTVFLVGSANNVVTSAVAANEAVFKFKGYGANDYQRGAGGLKSLIIDAKTTDCIGLHVEDARLAEFENLLINCGESGAIGRAGKYGVLRTNTSPNSGDNPGSAHCRFYNVNARWASIASICIDGGTSGYTNRDTYISCYMSSSTRGLYILNAADTQNIISPSIQGCDIAVEIKACNSNSIIAAVMEQNDIDVLFSDGSQNNSIDGSFKAQNCVDLSTSSTANNNKLIPLDQGQSFGHLVARKSFSEVIRINDTASALEGFTWNQGSWLYLKPTSGMTFRLPDDQSLNAVSYSNAAQPNGKLYDETITANYIIDNSTNENIIFDPQGKTVVWNTGSVPKFIGTTIIEFRTNDRTASWYATVLLETAKPTNLTHDANGLDGAAMEAAMETEYPAANYYAGVDLTAEDVGANGEAKFYKRGTATGTSTPAWVEIA